MIKFTERDIEIKAFLKKVTVADTETIRAIFFKEANIRTCQARLKLLVDYKFIKAFRPDFLSQNIFYINKKPSSYKHKLLFSQLLGKLHQQQDIEILKYSTPLKIKNVIADGFLAFRINGEVKLCFIEGELTKYFNLDKYLELYYSRSWKEVFPIFPSIIVITDKKIKQDHKLNIIKLDTELKNIKDIYKL